MADLASLRWLVPGVDGGGASGVDGALAALAVTGDAGDRERVLLGVRRGIEGAVGRGAGGAVAGDAVRWAPPLLTAASDVGEGKDCRRRGEWWRWRGCNGLVGGFGQGQGAAMGLGVAEGAGRRGGPTGPAATAFPTKPFPMCLHSLGSAWTA